MSIKHEIFVLDANLARPLSTDLYVRITERFIDDVLIVLGLDKLGDLVVHPATDMKEPGWSFIQPITTSHIAGHYFESLNGNPHIRVDAYSCDSIDWEKLLTICCKHFYISSWRANFIYREIEMHNRRIVKNLSGFGPNVQFDEYLVSSNSCSA